MKGRRDCMSQGVKVMTEGSTDSAALSSWEYMGQYLGSLGHLHVCNSRVSWFVCKAPSSEISTCPGCFAGTMFLRRELGALGQTRTQHFVTLSCLFSERGDWL